MGENPSELIKAVKHEIWEALPGWKKFFKTLWKIVRVLILIIVLGTIIAGFLERI